MVDKSKDTNNLSDFPNWALKSIAVFHFAEGYKYIAKFGNSAQSTVLNIMKYGDSGSARGNWMLRFDKAHPGTNYPHLNIRHKYTGIKDPHIKLPPGALTVAKYGGHISQFLNSLRKLTFALDGYRLCSALYKDRSLGTYDRTLKCCTSILFEWGGGLVGSAVGGCLGAIVVTGVGTLCGALVGGPAGVYYGAKLACKLTEQQQIENVRSSVYKYASKLKYY